MRLSRPLLVMVWRSLWRVPSSKNAGHVKYFDNTILLANAADYVDELLVTRVMSSAAFYKRAATLCWFISC